MTIHPVIISIAFPDEEEKEGAHALLAIGVEVDSNETITKILCLDPGCPSPKISSWNCFIDVSKENKSDYPFYCVSEDGHYKVRLDDMLIHCCPEKFYHKVSCLFESSSGAFAGSSGLL